MKLILAQGNPGEQFALTRHNVAFMIVDQYAAEHKLEFSAKPKFKAEIATAGSGVDKLIIAKPTTFYNETGQTIRAICDFYKITPSDCLIIHDELALPFGAIRTRRGGSDAGNNGIKSINSHFGADSARLRFGIANASGEPRDDANFVLSRFTREETQQLPQLIDKSCLIIDKFIDNQFIATTYN